LASAMGCLAWRAMGAGAPPILLLKLFCVFPALGFVACCVYFLRPLLAVIVMFLLLTGSFVTAYFVNLGVCLTRACSTADSIRVGWQTLAHGHALWALAIAALCLLMDYTRPTPGRGTALPAPVSDSRQT
jgi:hypothetical protein